MDSLGLVVLVVDAGGLRVASEYEGGWMGDVVGDVAIRLSLTHGARWPMELLIELRVDVRSLWEYLCGFS